MAATKREKLRQQPGVTPGHIRDLMARIASGGQSSNLPAVIESLQFSMTGLMIYRELTEDEWLNLIQDIRVIKRAYLWMLADLLKYGIERGYGDTHAHYEAIARLTGYTPEALQNFASVARSVEISRRRENLSFSHHTEVAPLSPDEQTDWLEQASVNHWSAKRLRAEIAAPQLPAITGTPEINLSDDDRPTLSGENEEQEAVDLPSPITDKSNRARFNHVWKKVVQNDLTMDDRQDVVLLRLWCDQVLQNMKHSTR